MLRHLGLIAVYAGIAASVGCDGSTLTAPDPPPGSAPTPPPPESTVTVEFGGRVVNADAGGPVGNVRVSLGVISLPVKDVRVFPKDTATSGGDGTFTLPLNLPSLWKSVSLELTGPPGYDDTSQSYERIGPVGDPFRPTAADRPAIRMYPTLVISPGESIEVRVDSSINVWCGWDGYACRRVLVAGSSDDPVELEVVSHDSGKPMALGLAIPGNPYILEPNISVRRLMVPHGRVPYVIGEYSTSTATLTARR